jgi:L-iditol 2-dehydrogenase
VKVARLQTAGEIRMLEEPTPVPQLGEQLVHVGAVGLCGSDLHWFAQAGIGQTSLEKPLVLGHEAAGVTPDGRRVALDPAISCGSCEYCSKGHPNLCVSLRFAGHGTQDGALRETLAWPEKCLISLPQSLTDADGAMLEPLGVALHAVDLGKLAAGARVGIFGCGPIGLLVLQVARISGADHIYFTEPLPHRQDAARQLGGTQWNPGVEVDVAFECAGANEAVEDAISGVRPGGRVVIVGIPDDDRTSFTASVARRKGLTIKLSRRMHHTYPRAIRLVAAGLIDVRSFVTHRFKLSAAAEAFRVARRREGLKVIVEPALEA